MPTTAPTAVSFKTMNAYCVARYGYDLLTVDPTCAMWVAEHFGGNANWSRIDAKRHRAGKHMPFPAFKSVCWA